MDFAKLINTAMQRPDGAAAPGDLFDTASAVELPVEDAVDDPRVIPGILKYPFEYRCRRFFMGKQLEAIDENTKIFNDVDESGDLREILEDCIQGRGVIFKKVDSVLSDGSVVVWLEWGVMPARKPRPKATEAQATLSEEELMSPKRVTPKSRAEDAEAGDVEDSDDEEGESHEDEDDW